MRTLDAIFSPESIAVVGASTQPGKVGHDIFANILKGGYSGTLYPVNPKARSVLSVRAYPSIGEIPDAVHLAIIILPPKLALAAVEEAIAKGVKGIVIVSAGFREVGGEGLEIENRIAALCKEAKVRLVGPNCLGVINPVGGVQMNASFSARMPKAGNISFISQSGALCTAVLDFAADRDIGFSKFISTGNKADVNELDLLRYLHDDPDTEVILIYLEELGSGIDFIESVKEITSGEERPTPILVIKSGRTVAGAAAAASHTGALAGTEAVYDAIFQQAGILRVDSIAELFDYATAFAYKSEEGGRSRRRVAKGNQVAIVTNAGGPGIVATDMTVSSGLQLAKFDPETVETLKSHLPHTANVHNPVDVIGDASKERYENALAAVIRDENVDGVLVILTPQSMTNALGTAEAIARIDRQTDKPIMCCFMGIIDVSAGVKFLQEKGIPVYRFPESAAKAFGALYRYSHWLNRQHLAQFETSYDTEKAKQIIADCLAQGKTRLGEMIGCQLLACYGFDVLPMRLAATADQAVQAAEEMGWPVVMKIASAQILHKSDAGGVVVGLKNGDEVRMAYTRILESACAYEPDAVIDGVVVQKMAGKGEELIMGMNRYPKYGPLLMLGTGGIFVEVFQDVVFRLAPIGRNETRRMIKSIKGYKLMQGVRGRPACDVDRLEQLIVNLSDLVTNHPEIQEMDINPLLLHEVGAGATVADCRMILKAAD